MEWLVRVGGIAASIPDPEIDDVQTEVTDRWTDSESWSTMCEWSGVIAGVSGYCLPVCAPIFVPAAGASAACAVALVIETVGDWFGWWD